MVLDNSASPAEQIMRLPARKKSEFMRNALTEVQMYGAASASEWLRDHYGLTQAQCLEIALEILTTNGAEAVVARKS